jgi:Flp pilus assembly pilin Flp
MNMLRNIWNDEQGQDLIEYTLLMAFVALASAALFIGAGGSIKGIWSSTNSQLAGQPVPEFSGTFLPSPADRMRP